MGILPGVATPAVAQALGHGPASLAVTQMYAGEITAPIHSIREQNAEAGVFVGRQARFVSSSPAPTPARPRLNEADLQQYLDERARSTKGPYAGKRLVSELSKSQRSSVFSLIRKQRAAEAARQVGEEVAEDPTAQILARPDEATNAELLAALRDRKGKGRAREPTETRR